MNAIPKKSQNYPGSQFYRNAEDDSGYAQNVEYLDYRRKAKLAAQKQAEVKKRRELEEYNRKLREIRMIAEIERYYSGDPDEYDRRQRKEDGQKDSWWQRAKKPQKPPGARKINPAYAVQSPQKPRSYGRGGEAVIGPGQGGFERPSMRSGAEGGKPQRTQRMEWHSFISPEREEAKPQKTKQELVIEEYKEQLAVAYTPPRRKTITCVIIIIAAVVIAGLFGLFYEVKLSRMTYDNSQSEHRISALEQEIDKLKMEEALKDNATNIQRRAQELGMYYPTDSQIEYMEAPPEEVYEPPAGDVAADTAQTAGTDGGSLLDRLGDAASGIKNFFDNAVKKIGEWVGNLSAMLSLDGRS